MLKLANLQAQNEWWLNKNYKSPENKWHKRDLFFILQKNLKHSLALNIVGLRRTGKSTILKQIINTLLENKINPHNIFYFLFDYPNQIQSPEFLDEILSIYLQEILKTRYATIKEKIYILLDEIQYIDNWQSILKRYYDLSNKKIKFIITGSQSLLLKEKSKESLAGRIFDYYLPPLSFSEFLMISNHRIKAFQNLNLFDLDKHFFDLTNYNIEYGQKLYELSKGYILYGQFPECQFLEEEQKYEYITQSIFGKVLEDCIKIHKIDKVNEFKMTFYQLLNNVSSIFELQNIGREIALSRITLEKYFEYFEKSYLFQTLFRYNKSLIKRGRTLKKLYASSTNFYCALNQYKKDHFEEVPEVFGKVIENIIFNILSDKYNHSKLNNNLSFLRKQEKEIDFLVSDLKNCLPIEVKFTRNIHINDLDFLVDFLQIKNLDYGIVITKNQLEKRQINGKILYFIPFYLVI